MRNLLAVFGTASISGLLLSFVITANVIASGSARAEDFADKTQQAAQTWALHRIAVIQAEYGDFQGAKRTATQIDRRWDPGPTQVTGVRFYCGHPCYFSLPGDVSPPRSWRRVESKRPTKTSVPSEVPPGLPADYLVPDQRHGAVVDFAEERDSRGTRVTTRVYADGHVVIETPREGRATDR
ncbi:MAG: hypothetical protein GX594_14260 [Pirellulaceae bacterium]|nr:hypothetical protein [Pirellulaceae bacterium]